MFMTLPKALLIIVCVSLLYYFNVVNGQFYPEEENESKSTLDDQYAQQRIETYLELGEEGFTKHYCTKYDVPESICDDVVNFTKSQIEELEKNQSSTSAMEPISYETHNDYEYGYSVEYPSDWHVGGYDHKIFKGTREFTIWVIDNPKFALLDTNNFGQITYEVDKERDGVKITDTPGRVNIDGEPALTYSYTEDDNEIMTMALMHNSVAYTFKYETLKENFEKDSDTMLHFFASIKFQ